MGGGHSFSREHRRCSLHMTYWNCKCREGASHLPDFPAPWLTHVHPQGADSPRLSGPSPPSPQTATKEAQSLAPGVRFVSVDLAETKTSLSLVSRAWRLLLQWPVHDGRHAKGQLSSWRRL